MPGGAVIHKLAAAAVLARVGPLRKLMNNCETDIRAADACIPTSACSEDLSVLGKMLEACALKQDSPGQPLVKSRANICRSFRAEHILLSRTQGYASFHPGLRSLTPLACSKMLAPENC